MRIIDILYSKFNVNKHNIFDLENNLTYEDLMDGVDERSNALIVNGIRKGDIVGIFMPNSIEYIKNLLSLLKIGAIPMPIHYYYQKKQLEKIVNLFLPKAILTLKDEDKEVDAFKHSQQVLMGKQKLILLQLQIAQLPDEVIFLCLTSGSTGKPKGVLLTDENIKSNANDINSYLKLCSSDKLVILRMLSHSSALTGELFTAMLSGAAVQTISSFDHELVNKILHLKEITVIGGSPAMIRTIGAAMKIRSIQPQIKKILISGSPITGTSLLNIKQLFPNSDFFHGYGLTEASPRVSCLLPHELENKYDSVGKPLPSVTVSIINEQSIIQSPYQVGEVVVEGLNIMLGYYNGKRVNNKLYTGDLGYFDAEGYLYIKGRKDDLIIREGINIYPIEIEEVLLTHPLIIDAYVYGKSDKLYGHKIIANIVISNKFNLEDEIIKNLIHDHCVSILGRTRMPQEINIVNEIKTNELGKRVKNAVD